MTGEKRNVRAPCRPCCCVIRLDVYFHRCRVIEIKVMHYALWESLRLSAEGWRKRDSRRVRDFPWKYTWFHSLAFEVTRQLNRFFLFPFFAKWRNYRIHDHPGAYCSRKLQRISPIEHLTFSPIWRTKHSFNRRTVWLRSNLLHFASLGIFTAIAAILLGNVFLIYFSYSHYVYD